ncbi:hypothetical protein [Bradyrhizobium sp. S3.9.1]|uniref:hypothetical protein n=1 Tax=Bradyrhizobium sp. S3.9.1 TaxID=3156431 RepID=UPI00339110CF
MTDATADFHRIADAIEAGADLSSEQRILVAAALRLQALTLPAARHDERDRLLIECRRKFYAGRTDHDAAHELATDWRRYAAAGWIRERSCEVCPPRHIGTSREFFWLILRQSPRVLSAERIRKIVGHLK